MQVRHLGHVEHGRDLGKVPDGVQGRGAVQTVARLALRRPGAGQRLQHDRRRGAGRIDLDAGVAGSLQGLTRTAQGGQVGSGGDGPGLVVEQQRGKGGDPGEAGAVQGIQLGRHRGDLGRIEAALVPAVEGVARGLDAGEQLLGAACPVRGAGRLARLGFAEHRPVVRRDVAGGGVRLEARHLHQVAEVPDAHAGRPDGARACHVDGHRAVDAAALQRPAEAAVASDLLGHREHGEAERVRALLERARVVLHRVQVEDVAVRGYAARLVQGDRRLHQVRVAASEDVQKHRFLPVLTGSSPAGTRPPRRG